MTMALFNQSATVWVQNRAEVRALSGNSILRTLSGLANDLSLNCGEAHGATGDAARCLPQLTNSRRAASANGVTPPLLDDSLAGSAGGPHSGPPSVAVRELARTAYSLLLPERRTEMAERSRFSVKCEPRDAHD